jgi:hypothetical protein
MMRGATILFLAAIGTATAAMAGAVTGCEVEEVTLHRDNCNVCHQPLDDTGTPTGLEESHPWAKLSCVDCHGGNPRLCDGEIVAGDCSTGWVYDKTRAHVDPNGSPPFIRNLPASTLDEVDPDYLRFINPGDYRVAQQTCGGGALGAACHATVVETALRSTMAHTSGEVTVARYRAGKQASPHAQVGSVALTDSNHDDGNACTVQSIAVFDPPPIDVASTDEATAPTVANAQDQYMVKSCFRCHLEDFGENRFPGDFRSSGCTACHLTYADDGLSRSADPTIDKNTAPHAKTHQMTTSPPVEQCTHCHYRGGRIGIGYQGYRESPGAGLTPPNVDVLGVALHAHDANYYITDEDNTNDWDETPADVHFEAGMHCVDCHTLGDVHGDGSLTADSQCAVESECTDCHGTVRERARPSPERNNLYERDGKLYLRTKLTNKELEVRQTVDSVTKGHANFSPIAFLGMGVNDNGFSHADELECYTCHASWTPSCYGCHVSVDLTRFAPYHTTGVEQAGAPAGGRKWIQLFDLVLMRNTDGMLAPSMPAERLFMTLLSLDEEQTQAQGKRVTKNLFESKPRSFTFPGGRTIAGFGQRAFNPHTTRKRSAFMACDRCHSVGDANAPSNEVLLDVTHGFGTQRFEEVGCDVSNADPSCDPETDFTTYQLDAIMTRAGEPLVVVGHPDPIESRVLTLQEVARMRAVVVAGNEMGFGTEIPADAATNPDWPFALQVE